MDHGQSDRNGSKALVSGSVDTSIPSSSLYTLQITVELLYNGHLD